MYLDHRTARTRRPRIDLKDPFGQRERLLTHALPRRLDIQRRRLRMRRCLQRRPHRRREHRRRPSPHHPPRHHVRFPRRAHRKPDRNVDPHHRQRPIDLGPLNQFVHLWAYESLADYERRCQARDTHLGFVAYLAASEHLIVAQETRLVRAVDMPGRAAPAD